MLPFVVHVRVSIIGIEVHLPRMRYEPALSFLASIPWPRTDVPAEAFAGIEAVGILAAVVDLAVNKLEREGAQIGSLQCAFVKLTPRAASRSKFGVGICGLPSECSGMSLRSSTMMNKTFGRC